jgi:hypothetical protein
LIGALWGYFYPRPYGLCIAVLIALPWLSILASRLVHGSNALAYTTVAPFTVLGTRAFDDLEFSLARLAAFACAMGAVFAAGVFLADRTAWRRYSLLLILGPLFYGFGAAGEANVLLDTAATKISAVPIVDRDYHIGRPSTFYLVLAPWGDRSRSNRNSVSWNAYLALRGQSKACIDLGPGALGVRWYKIGSCDRWP